MLIQGVSTPRSKVPFAIDTCASPPRCASPPCGSPRARDREDSVKRKALIMHARLGCVACREKLQIMRRAMAAKSPGRVDRSPSPCEHVAAWPSRCFEAECIPDAIADRPRGRRALNTDALLSTPRGTDLQKLRPFSSAQAPAKRSNSRERLRSRQLPSRRSSGSACGGKGTPQSSKRFANKSDTALNSYGEISTHGSQEEPHPELSPGMVPRQRSIDGKDWSHGVCEIFIKTINNARSAQNWQSLPSWAEVFAKYGSRWETEAETPSDAATPSVSSSKLAEGCSGAELHSGPGQTFTNAEECLRFLHTPTPFQQLRGAPPRQFTTVEECLEFLKTPAEFPNLGALATREDAGAADAQGTIPNSSELAEVDRRADEAAKEVDRITALRVENFPDKAEWAYAILECASADAASDPSSVQRCFRGLMRKLHPDRVGHSSELAQAVEVLRQAKEIAQKHVSEVEPPGLPQNFQFATLCATRGQRRIRLQWAPPEDSGRCPVRRYVVRVVDPVAGRALTVAVLEPDYDEDLRRFVSVEELGCYVLAEQELQMPGVWREVAVTLQVAAANEAGTSSWSVVKIPLATTPAASLAVPMLGVRQQSPSPLSRTECQPTSRFMGHPTRVNAAAARIGIVG